MPNKMLKCKSSQGKPVREEVSDQRYNDYVSRPGDIFGEIQKVGSQDSSVEHESKQFLFLFFSPLGTLKLNVSHGWVGLQEENQAPANPESTEHMMLL